MKLQPGTQLGHYEISSLLGSGGMGEVYRAKDHKLGRDVAIKVLREELASDPERLRRFEQEARSASALNHPNIITIHDIRLRQGYGGQVGKTVDVDFIVMEFVEGTTLREMLSDGPLPTKKLLQLATQIAEGLAKAHSAGIIHRDLKHENLMVTSDGYVKILDFGLAKLRPQTPETQSEAPTATKEGTVLGTVGYMSPEQAKGQPADYRSDQFSLGAILYEMVTGKRAFERDSSVQTLSAIIEQEPASIAATQPETPVHLRFIVERCLAKNPEERYDSTRDLARELKSIGEIDAPLPSEPIAAQSKKRSTWPRIVAIAGGMTAVLAILLALNVGGLRDWAAGGPSQPQINSIAILPLENLSGDPEQEYFVNGMTEELTNKLSRIRNLQVASRTSAARFKGKEADIREVGRELGVGYVLEGSVRKADKRVRITAQLIDASTGFQLWSDDFEGDLKDVFSVQEQTALEIAEALDLRLSPQEQQAVLLRYTNDPKAYDAYLQGQALVQYAGDPKKLEAAQGYFEQALQEDPDYALALAGLSSVEAHTYRNLESIPAHLERAEQLAKRALAIDSQLARAHVAMGEVYAIRYEYAQAAEKFQEATRLTPNDPWAWDTLSWALAYQTPPDAHGAEDAARQAIRLQPQFSTAYYHLGRALILQRRYEDAKASFEYMLELEPGSDFAYTGLSQLYLAQGDYERALLELERVSGYGSVHWVLYGTIYVGLGEKEKALDELERAIETGYRDRAYLESSPYFDPIRSDPRFQDLMRRMNSPE